MTSSGKPVDAGTASADPKDAKPVRTVPLPFLLVSSWLVPGSGHLVQRRWTRGIVFFLLVALATALGAFLDGKLFWFEAGRPLATLGTFASMGSGLFFVLLRGVLDYQGDIRAATYEYGGAFLLTAGLMNLLAVIDALDVASGRKP